jgi:hypothetical protein
MAAGRWFNLRPFSKTCGFRLDDNTAVKGWAGKMTALPGFKTSFDLLPVADTVITV